MAIYVPDSTRRRRLIGIAGACLVVGLIAGGAIGRATSPGADDAVAEVQERGRETVTALQRLPIEYEQAVAGEGGEDAGTMTSALDRARATLDEAFAVLEVFGPASRAAADDALDALQESIDDGVPPSEFDAAIEAAIAVVRATFGLPSD